MQRRKFSREFKIEAVNRAASIRHARSAIVYGQDDALALTWAGFSIGAPLHSRHWKPPSPSAHRRR